MLLGAANGVSGEQTPTNATASHLVVAQAERHEPLSAERLKPPVQLLGGDVVLGVAAVAEAEDGDGAARKRIRRQRLAEKQLPERAEAIRRVALLI